MVHLVVVALAAFVAAALLTAAGVAAFRMLAQHAGWLDVPNARSSHSVPVPRAAGVVFVIVAPVVFAAAQLLVTGGLPDGVAAWWATSWLLAAVSLYDDWRGLPAVLRLAVQLAVAAAFLAATGTWMPPWRALLLVLWLVGASNAYNFMDGVDGLAAGQALLGMGALAGLGLLREHAWLPVLAAALSGGALGFLVHNFPPARVFMGDVGSVWLGYSFASLAVLNMDRGVPFAASVVVLGMFLADVGATLLLRIRRRERILDAHRTHFYQRLVRAGWSHAQTTGFYLLGTGWLGLLSVAYFGYARIELGWLLLGCALPFVAVLAFVWQAERRNGAAAPA